MHSIDQSSQHPSAAVGAVAGHVALLPAVVARAVATPAT